MWPSQSVMIKGKKFYLTRLGFGLNAAPLVMKSIIATVQSQEASIGRATSAYTDDVYVNENIMSAEYVRVKLAQYGLWCKCSERLKDGTRVFGLEVLLGRNTLWWTRWNAIPNVRNVMTRRNVVSLCEKLVNHLPRVWMAECGYRAHQAARKRNHKGVGWLSWQHSPPLKQVVKETGNRVR